MKILDTTLELVKNDYANSNYSYWLSLKAVLLDFVILWILNKSSALEQETKHHEHFIFYHISFFTRSVGASTPCSH
jgi:hypothetical protein